jgi:hypothetical protein
MPNRILCVVCALAGILLGFAFPAAAQPAPSPARQAYKQELVSESLLFQARVEQVAHAMGEDARFKNLTHEQRAKTVEFVSGNLLFVLFHELGHALVSEMGLPVLGKEEDAVDAYAVLAMLMTGNKVSDGVLTQATRGWFLDAKRNAAEGVRLAFYDAHSLDQQRAYDIVCLMVGSDPDKFAAAADNVHMPAERQASCAGDYSNAHWSWMTVLAPHHRPAAEPKQKFNVVYAPGQGEYDVVEQHYRTIGILEMVADLAADRYVWRRPITFEMKTCGSPNGDWDLAHQTVLVCYEMARDFANLYRDYGLAPAAAPAAKAK